MQEIPYGYCHCGCGQKTTIARSNCSITGYVKGQPKKYVNHHYAVHMWWRGGVSKDKEYIYVKNSGHHRATQHGYVRAHILEAERIIGKPVLKGMVVHHRGEKSDNENVEVFENQSEHAVHHANERAMAACGHEDWRKCHVCHEYDDLKNMVCRGHGHHYHDECRKRQKREYYHKNKTKKD